MKIAIVGPESSGKTTLCEHLAKFFDAELVNEFSRIFLDKQESKYSESDLVQIAHGQYQALKRAEAASAELIIQDTDVLSIRVWSDIKYGRCDPKINEWIINQEIDYYILCKPDLPWEQDPLRESPDVNDRMRIYQHFEKELDKFAFKYFVLEGHGDTRLQLAVNFIQDLL